MKRAVLFIIFLLLLGISCGNRVYQQPRTMDHKIAVDIMFNDIYPVLEQEKSYKILSDSEGQMTKGFGWSRLVKIESFLSYDKTKNALTMLAEGYLNNKLSYSSEGDLRKSFEVSSGNRYIIFGCYDKEHNYWYISLESK